MPSPSRPPTLLQGLARVVGVVAGLALTVAGLVLMLFTVLAGLFAATGLALWARLRGQPRSRRRRRGPRHRPGSAPDGDVVDVEVREIPDRREP